MKKIRINYSIFRIIHSLVLVFSIIASILLASLILPAVAGVSGLIVLLALWLTIYLGLAKLFDKYFQIPK